MNKRNFGRVIKRIERSKMWDQGTPPNCAVTVTEDYDDTMKHDCKTPYCFLGHAEYLRTGRKFITPANGVVECSPTLAKWLGLSMQELYCAFAPTNTLADFKRWHKAGKVT
jgi:hypothetical protein